MARRLLGPANAASVLDTQGEENMQNAQVTGDLSLELGFPVIVLWPACAWTGQRWGLFGTSAGEGLALKGRAVCGRGLVFHRVMAEEENLSTIPLLCLICRNDLSREEFQQLLHSAVPSACDRQGAAPWGSQVPTPTSLSTGLARTTSFTPVTVQNKWHWLQEVMALGSIGWVLALPGGCNN